MDSGADLFRDQNQRISVLNAERSVENEKKCGSFFDGEERKLRFSFLNCVVCQNCVEDKCRLSELCDAVEFGTTLKSQVLYVCTARGVSKCRYPIPRG